MSMDLNQSGWWLDDSGTGSGCELAFLLMSDNLLFTHHMHVRYKVKNSSSQNMTTFHKYSNISVSFCIFQTSKVNFKEENTGCNNNKRLHIILGYTELAFHKRTLAVTWHLSIIHTRE